MKLLLKQKGFKWKTVKNDVVTGHRSEILEIGNFDNKV